jgi:hypothetical protein
MKTSGVYLKLVAEFEIPFISEDGTLIVPALSILGFDETGIPVELCEGVLHEVKLPIQR